MLMPLTHAAISLFPGNILYYVEGEEVLSLGNGVPVLNGAKRKRGRPAGSKDKKPRKPRNFGNSWVIDI